MGNTSPEFPTNFLTESSRQPHEAGAGLTIFLQMRKQRGLPGPHRGRRRSQGRAPRAQALTLLRFTGRPFSVLHIVTRPVS